MTNTKLNTSHILLNYNLFLHRCAIFSCILICTLILTTPNIKIYIFNIEIGLVFSTLFLSFFSLWLWFSTPISKFTNNKILIVIFSVLTVGYIYTFIDIINWLANTPEGLIQYRCLHIVKIAPLDIKISLYLSEINQCITILSKNNYELQTFLDSHVALHNPEISRLLKTSYDKIAILAKQDVINTIKDYNDLVNIRKISNGYDKIEIIKWIAVCAFAGISLYFIYTKLFSALNSDLKKILQDMQQNNNKLTAEVLSLTTIVESNTKTQQDALEASTKALGLIKDLAANIAANKESSLQSFVLIRKSLKYLTHVYVPNLSTKTSNLMLLQEFANTTGGTEIVAFLGGILPPDITKNIVKL